MIKKAIITIRLVQDLEKENNEVVKNQILKAVSLNSIPFCSEVENVEIEKQEDSDIVEKLKANGFSKAVVDNIVMFYQ